jgi:hypothetical protein
MIRAKLTGDWEKARTILNNSSGVTAAINIAVLREAQQARRDMIKGITEQAPAGQQFTPLAAITLALRKAKGFRGTKALIVTAQLRNSITTKNVAPGMVFVGVLKNAQGSDGRQLYNIARVHEMGATIVIRVTPRMRVWLMTMLRKSGFGVRIQGRDKRGRYKKAAFVPHGLGGLAKGIIIVKIPARPFLQPVINRIIANPKAAQARLTLRIAQHLKLTMGRP